MIEKKLQDELRYLQNPMAVITDYTNKLIEVLESADQFSDTEEIIRELWEQQKEELKNRMTKLAADLTLQMEETDELLNEANDLINPKKDDQ